MILLILIYTNLYSYISIYPIGFDKNIEKENFQEYILYNTTPNPIIYRVRIKEMNKKNVIDMSKWLKLSSKVIFINPSENKKLQITVEAPKNLPQGDYGAYLNIEQIDGSKYKEDKDTRLSILMDFTMGLYGYVGDNNKDIEFLNISLFEENGKIKLKGDIKNNNNRLVKLLLVGVTKNSSEYIIDEYRVFKNEKLNFESEIKYISNKNNIEKIIVKDLNTLEVLSEINIKK